MRIGSNLFRSSIDQQDTLPPGLQQPCWVQVQTPQRLHHPNPNPNPNPNRILLRSLSSLLRPGYEGHDEGQESKSQRRTSLSRRDGGSPRLNLSPWMRAYLFAHRQPDREESQLPLIGRISSSAFGELVSLKDGKSLHLKASCRPFLIQHAKKSECSTLEVQSSTLEVPHSLPAFHPSLVPHSFPDLRSTSREEGFNFRLPTSDFRLPTFDFETLRL
jgi:hypothetical protein